MEELAEIFRQIIEIAGVGLEALTAAMEGGEGGAPPEGAAPAGSAPEGAPAGAAPEEPPA